VPPRGVLAVDEITVDHDVEDPVAALLQGDVGAELLLEAVRQTGGSREVVSLDAVADLDAHGRPPGYRVARVVRGCRGGCGGWSVGDQ